MRDAKPASAPLSSSSSSTDSKPVSAKRLAANRANARRSTGPRTEAGKARSSRNAVTHGLTSQASVLPGEDEVELRELAEEMQQDLRPRGAGQRRLVERIVSLTWRLRRIAAAEEAMYFVEERDIAVDVARARRLREVQDAAREQIKQDPPEKRELALRSPLMGREVANIFADLQAAAVKEVDGDSPDARPEGATYVARQFLSNRDDNAIERLARYEQRLDRQLHAAYRQLIALRKMQGADAEEDDDVPDDLEPEAESPPESMNRQNEPTAGDAGFGLPPK